MLLLISCAGSKSPEQLARDACVVFEDGFVYASNRSASQRLDAIRRAAEIARKAAGGDAQWTFLADYFETKSALIRTQDVPVGQDQQVKDACRRLRSPDRPS